MKALVDPLLGRAVLNRYRVVRVLAQGGMGVLYLGRTEGAAGFSRPVVIKRILPHLIANPRMAGLFVREARILSELQHPGIVNILDFGEEDGAYIMVLEFVRGYDLGLWHRYLRSTGGLLTGDVAIQILIRALEALHYAHTFVRPDGHKLKVVHRDVSLGNVLLDTEGHVKLLDFGIARFSDDAGEYRTKEGEFKGKAAYTAPEIFRGEAASVQSDVFAAGVVLYKVLAGFNPFEGENAMETVKRIAEFEPSPISHIRSDLRRQLNEVLARALAKAPEDRFQSAANFAEALRACRRQGEEATQERLVADIQRDFLGDMPPHLGIEPLTSLDTAWRAPNSQEAQAQTVAGVASDAKQADSLRALSKPAFGRPILWVGLTLGAVSLGAGVMAIATMRPKQRAAAFMVVENRPAEPETEPEALAASALAANEPATKAAALQPTTRAPAPKASGPDAAALTRTFRRQRAKIESCFEAHASLIAQTPQIAIAFNVSAEGVVESARIVPDSLSSTPLASCLLQLARTTNFGNQKAAVAFRIPLRARQWP